ncbi:MAG TPA: tetratricopeptide repeat protein [Gemmatimonadaceae bacterium]|jgi:tetratricopeptide (TPR) repeat protein|nr:tetratricopeptide repeat protein [Gemmatimonadaceae bacterium]
MTNPSIPTKRLGADEESFTEWFMLHKREVSWAIIALAIVVAGYWYYERSQSLKAQRAETAYFQARQSAAVGNLPLAVSDLQKVATRYAGTRAGAQASMTLAQALFQQQKFREGIVALKKAEAKAPADFRPSIHVLEAAGLEELRDFAAAAEQYKVAATETKFPADKAQYQAYAARDYMAAGKTEDAKAIWTELAKDETGPMAAEAKVRLGELLAKPMTA